MCSLFMGSRYSGGRIALKSSETSIGQSTHYELYPVLNQNVLIILLIYVNPNKPRFRNGVGNPREPTAEPVVTGNFLTS